MGRGAAVLCHGFVGGATTDAHGTPPHDDNASEHVYTLHVGYLPDALPTASENLNVCCGRGASGSIMIDLGRSHQPTCHYPQIPQPYTPAPHTRDVTRDGHDTARLSRGYKQLVFLPPSASIILILIVILSLVHLALARFSRQSTT